MAPELVVAELTNAEPVATHTSQNTEMAHVSSFHSHR